MDLGRGRDSMMDLRRFWVFTGVSFRGMRIDKIRKSLPTPRPLYPRSLGASN
jgi:hypothetical protein